MPSFRRAARCCLRQVARPGDSWQLPGISLPATRLIVGNRLQSSSSSSSSSSPSPSQPSSTPSSSSASSPSPSSSSTSSSSSSPQYWRTDRIVQHIAEQHAAAADDKDGDSKKKKTKDPLVVRLAGKVQRGVVSLTETSIDLIAHPSHIPPLLVRAYHSIVSTLHHYYTGTRLLLADVRTAYRLARKTTKGHTLSRRERRQLQRTTIDLMRLVPFSIFVVVPFMELLLPVALRLFPNLLPSTFQSAHKREEQLKRELKARLNVASFLQDTVESMAKRRVKAAGEEAGQLKDSAEELLRMLKAARAGQRLSTQQLERVARLFDDEITFESLSSEQLRHVCRYLGLQVYGGDSIMRYAIHLKMQTIHRDDEMIRAEGMDRMSDDELRAACRARGMRDFGLTRDGYMRNLQQWMDLSLNKKIPDSLLLLSRAMSINEAPSSDEIATALSSLSEESIDELAAEAGITDNDQRLAILRRQNELIASEEAKQKEKEIEKQKRKEAKAAKEREDAVAAAMAKGATRHQAEKQLDAERAQAASSPSPQPSTPAVSKPSAAVEKEDRKQGEKQPAEAEEEGEDVLSDLGTLAEGLLSMTQPSAVEEERKRLQRLLEKAEAEAGKKRELEVVKQMRPAMDATEGEKQKPHPIQTLDDLASWHVSRLKEAEQQHGKQDSGQSQQQQQQEKAKEQEEEKEEAEEDDSGAERLSSQLSSMLGGLRQRLSAADAEIGERLHLLRPSSFSGRVDDSELSVAISRLQKVRPGQTQQLIARIKKMAKERKGQQGSKAGQQAGVATGGRAVIGVGVGDGQQEVQLTVDDLRALAEQLLEESEAKRKEGVSEDSDDSKEDDSKQERQQQKMRSEQ